jgi:acyl-CoA dehydrogenase
MISFEYSQAQRNVRDMVHWFAKNEIRPHAIEADRAGEFPVSLLQKLMMMGIGGGALPGDRHGDTEGAGSTPDKKGVRQTNRMAAIGSEEMAWGDPALVTSIPGAGLGAPPVRIMGTEEQKKRFFGVFKNDGVPRYGAYALTEPDAGSDSKAISTTCVKDGDHWILNGTKCFITNGAKAEWTVIFATVDKSLGRQGFRTFVVERGTPGFKVGRIEKKMGLRASETAELIMEDCRVPAENLLGGEAHYASKEGFVGAMKTFDNTRPLVAAMAVGIARAANELARDFLKERYELNRPIPRYRRLQETVAENFRRIDAARLLVWRAAWMADANQSNTKEASMCKAYSGTIAMRACADAVQVMGAHGLERSSLVEKFFRDIKVYDIFEGTGEVQRVVIARRLLTGRVTF